jgi:hypothetical protein
VTDALNTIEFDDYFVILPSMVDALWSVDEFRRESNGSPGRRRDYGFSYDSGTNERFLTVEELRGLIASEIHA